MSKSGGVRAAEVLYGIGELILFLTFVTELTGTSVDVATFTALGELIARHPDAQARGLSTERYAFPEIGVPAYNPLTSATLRQPMQSG